MATDIGEYIVGAYLQLKLGCGVVSYNVRPPGGGTRGLEEIDVIGLNLKTHRAILCEVTTHIHGLRYGTIKTTVSRVKDKLVRMKKYGVDYLDGFRCSYMLWSPVVAADLAKRLGRLGGLRLVLNGRYKRRVDWLRAVAKKTAHDTTNPFFRMLQVIEHTRDDPPARRRSKKTRWRRS